MGLRNFKKIIEINQKLNEEYESVNGFTIWNIVQFYQSWSSTALGFSEIGGSALTSALTTVVLYLDEKADVWFGGRKAYTVNSVSEKRMLSVWLTR